MFILCVLLWITVKIRASNIDYLQHPLKACHVGDIVQNECTKCICTTKTIFECTALDCNNNKYELNKMEIAQQCYPNQLYVQNLISCICTKDGRWPHKSCEETFNSLPPSTVTKQRCEPNSYVIIDCNVCRCGPTGELLSNRCTKNVCEEDTSIRRSNKRSSVYGNCEINNWYSLAACQFCFCSSENRLVCNTGNHYSKNLELGSYNLVVCGKDLIKDAMELIPDNESVLRLGLPTEKTPILLTTKTPVPANLNVQKDIHVDVSEDENMIKSKHINGSDEEYYSDTDDEKLHSIVDDASESSAKKGISTQNPYQEGDDTGNENDYESDKRESLNEESSNEIEVEMPVPVPTKRPVEIAYKPSIDKPAASANAKTLSAFGETFKINLPKVLNKVFQMALRKSMVSLNSGTKCSPGTTSMKACNMCFCLKNSKMLCTNNRCN